jgi:glycosyltransferase involved in cell wall biosynthesis
LDIDDAAVLIGTVANFRARKDHPNLLRAARQIIDAGVDVTIIAVGQGPDEAAITKLHQQLNLEDHVILAGFGPNAVDVIGACDIFTLALAWEGLPVAVMEALTLGLPIVATRVGGLAESLDETGSVLVAPGDSSALADALTTLVVDPERPTELASGARVARCQRIRLVARHDDHHRALRRSRWPRSHTAHSPHLRPSNDARHRFPQRRSAFDR